MGGLPWHKRYQQDEENLLLTSSLEERSAYNTLVNRIMINDGPLALDYRMLGHVFGGVRAKKAEKLISRLVDLGLASIKDGEITAPQFEEQLIDRRKTHERHRKTGRTGGLKRAENERMRREPTKKANDISRSSQGRLKSRSTKKERETEKENPPNPQLGDEVKGIERDKEPKLYAEIARLKNPNRPFNQPTIYATPDVIAKAKLNLEHDS